MKRFLLAVAFLGILAAAAYGYQSYKVTAAPPPDAPRPAPAIPVVTAQVVRQAMPVQIEGIGTVQPIATAVVKSRIDGQIAKVMVRDGQEVKAGDVLMT